MDETMTTSDTPIDEPDYPYPRRYAWLKRGIAAYLLLALALVGLRIVWGRIAQHRLDATIAGFHAHGQPALVEDLNGPKIPDAENAAFYYLRAISKLNKNIVSPAASNMYYSSYPPYPKAWYTMADASAKANRAAFDDAREARRHPRAQWLNNYASPLLNVSLRHLSGMRNLANHVSDNALLGHFNGNDAEAIDGIRDVWAMADALGQETSLISHLVELGIRALALNRLEIMAPELTVQAISPTTRPTDHPASRGQIEALIGLLLDDTIVQNTAAHSYQTERMAQIDTILYFPRDTKVLWPMFQLDAVSAARRNETVIASTTQPNWPAAEKSLRKWPWPGGSPEPTLAHALSNAMYPAINRARQNDFKIQMEAHLAATILAVRLYRLDHHGEFPRTLDTLVPKYLPSVPVDPFKSDGGRIGYLGPAVATHPLVYSIGDDGVDDTARLPTTSPSEPMNGWENRTADQWRDLTRWAPPPKPKSTQPVNPGDESTETLEE
jgi:hypothetical protein